MRRLAGKIGRVRKTRITDGAAIRARRLALGLDRLRFADLTDVSASYLKHIELYGYQPSDRIVRAIADGLDCGIADISAAREQRDAA